MSVASPLVRIAGPAALASAALITIGFGFGLAVDTTRLGEAAQGGPFVVSSGLNLIGVFLLAVALVGIHWRQADRAGLFGALGLAAALIGTMMAAGGYASFFFTYPAVAARAPEALSGPPAGILLATLGFGAGWLVFGLASLRAGVLPRPAVYLWIAGAAASVVVAVLPIPRVCLLLTGLGVGLAGLGMLRAHPAAADPEDPAGAGRSAPGPPEPAA